jgi:hypothetical protein
VAAPHLTAVIFGSKNAAERLPATLPFSDLAHSGDPTANNVLVVGTELDKAREFVFLGLLAALSLTTGSLVGHYYDNWELGLNVMLVFFAVVALVKHLFKQEFF